MLGLLVLLTLLAIAQPAFAKVTEAELAQINQQWQGSAHALAEVNCSSCHRDEQTKAVVAQPSHESCRTCHTSEVETFLLGKHGIRLLEGETPLTPALARLPMKSDVQAKAMNCNTCHNVHTVNTFQASTDSCLTCHNDTHSLNYRNSKHAQQVLAEDALPRPSAQSVTCATCHLPRHGSGVASDATVVVNHNNTYNLKPRDRMVQDVCMNCHGLEYSYNSIFDDDLVTANFARPPTQKLQTFELVRALEKRRSGEADRP